MINLGIHAEGQQSQDRLFLYNAGTDSLYLSDFPQSRYFDFSYAPSFDTNTDEKMQPGSCAAVAAALVGSEADVPPFPSVSPHPEKHVAAIPNAINTAVNFLWFIFSSVTENL